MSRTDFTVGPTPSEIHQALEDVLDKQVPGTPHVEALKVLRDAAGNDWTVANRELLSFTITHGQPRHGALRSDDHVGQYEVQVPFHEVSPEVFADAECPACDHEWAIYTYNTHHNISGSEAVVCAHCEATVHTNEWG